MAIRAFVVEDHELLRAGIRAVLDREDDIEVVGEAGTASEARRGLEQWRPHVMLIDPRLPDGDGLDLCREATDVAPNVRCLVLAPRADDELLTATIRSGAAGFLLTRTTVGELVRSVRVIAAGGSLIDPSLLGRLLERVRTGGNGPTAPDAALSHLSPQERRLLDLLAEGLTNRQVAARMGLAEKTVKNYVSNLLRKLHMSSRTEAAVYVTSMRMPRASSFRGESSPDESPLRVV